MINLFEFKQKFYKHTFSVIEMKRGLKVFVFVFLALILSLNFISFASANTFSDFFSDFFSGSSNLSPNEEINSSLVFLSPSCSPSHTDSDTGINSDCNSRYGYYCVEYSGYYECGECRGTHEEDDCQVYGEGNWKCENNICIEETQCISNWVCDEWSACSNGIQTQICTDLNYCKDQKTNSRACISESGQCAGGGEIGDRRCTESIVKYQVCKKTVWGNYRWATKNCGLDINGNSKICSDGKCVTTCDYDLNCPEGKICSYGQCSKAECKDNSNCNNGFICESGRCFSGCIENSQCGVGSVCDSDGKCIPESCRNNAECPGQICRGGSCRDIECRNNGGLCSDGKLCEVNLCLGCYSDEECDKASPGYTCVDKNTSTGFGVCKYQITCDTSTKSSLESCPVPNCDPNKNNWDLRTNPGCTEVGKELCNRQGQCISKDTQCNTNDYQCGWKGPGESECINAFCANANDGTPQICKSVTIDGGLRAACVEEGPGGGENKDLCPVGQNYLTSERYKCQEGNSCEVGWTGDSNYQCSEGSVCCKKSLDLDCDEIPNTTVIDGVDYSFKCQFRLLNPANPPKNCKKDNQIKSNADCKLFTGWVGLCCGSPPN